MRIHFMQDQTYTTIIKPAQDEFTERKSRFIGYIAPAKSEAEAIAYISGVKAQNRKANHNCYAYVLRENNISRHSDDGEPSGTAGLPILNVLTARGLTDVICVVTRYFGGILLGAPGLTRAYGQAAALAANASEIKTFTLSREVAVTVSYSLYGRLPAVFAAAGAAVQSEDFAADVTIRAVLPTKNVDGLCAAITDATAGRAQVAVGEERYYGYAVGV
jgi:uncharacterized YigZ family protein